MQLFEIILFSTICVCIITMMYYRLLKPELAKRTPEPMALDYARSFFPVLLIVFVLRGFVVEPFRIPSGSMLSNLEVGDFILVNKFSYGIRLPILQNKVVEVGQPDRGDVVVFRYPPNPKQNYIKRLIGVPGDTVEYDPARKQLYVNGQLVNKELDGEYQAYGANFKHAKFKQVIERSDGSMVEFPILNIGSGNPFASRKSWVVPAGHYFVMGDNRDNSADSRSRNFTFVPDENIVGKAFFVWMHMNFGGDGFKFSRIGTDIEAVEVSK